MSVRDALLAMTEDMKDRLFLHPTTELRRREADFQTMRARTPPGRPTRFFHHPTLRPLASEPGLWPAHPPVGSRCMHCVTSKFPGPPIPSVSRYEEEGRVFWAYGIFCSLRCLYRYLGTHEGRMSTKRLLVLQQMCLEVFGVDEVEPAPPQLRLWPFMGSLSTDPDELSQAVPSELIQSPFLQSDLARSARVPPRNLKPWVPGTTDEVPHPWLQNTALRIRKTQFVTMQGVEYELQPNPEVKVTEVNCQTFVRDELEKDHTYEPHNFWNGRGISDWAGLVKLVESGRLLCANCKHSFQGFMPLPIPIAFDEVNEVWTFLGFSCSFNCGKRFIINHYPRRRPWLLVFFGIMTRRIFKIQRTIVPAEAISVLQAFVGPDDIATYRKEFIMLRAMPSRKLPFLRAELYIQLPRVVSSSSSSSSSSQATTPMTTSSRRSPSPASPSPPPSKPQPKKATVTPRKEPFGTSYYEKVLRENAEIRQLLAETKAAKARGEEVGAAKAARAKKASKAAARAKAKALKAAAAQALLVSGAPAAKKQQMKRVPGTKKKNMQNDDEGD